MKKYTILFLALVLTAVALTGCMSTGNMTEPTTMPTTMPATAPTTMPTVPPTHQTETTATQPAATDDTMPMAPDSTAATDTMDATDHTQGNATSRTR